VFDIVRLTCGTTTAGLAQRLVDMPSPTAAERLVVLADHTEWGTVGMSSIVPLHRADVVIAGDALDGVARAVLAGQVQELILVGAP
jgi:hypothetical protein